MSRYPSSRPAARGPVRAVSLTLSLLTAASILAACGGGGDGGSSTIAPYTVDRSPATALSTTAIDATDPLALATAGALMREAVEEAEDAVDDVDELLAATSRNCSHGGSLTVTDGTTADGARTRLLSYASCRTDDDLTEGEVLLTCTASDCTRDGTLRYGNGDVAYMEQSLDDDPGDNDNLTVLWRGEIRYSGWDTRLDSGALSIDLRQDRADAGGAVGAVALEGFQYTANVQGSTSTRSYEGGMMATAFDLARGGCSAPGATTWSTSMALQGDADGDRIDAGNLIESSAGAASLVWSSGGQVVATGPSGRASAYTATSFEGLCDF